jgi:hydrogenase/urease accessory protein HupE
MVKINRATIPKTESPWQFVLGVLAADLGVALLGLGAWEALNNETRILVYLGGCIWLSSGLSLIWLDTSTPIFILITTY